MMPSVVARTSVRCTLSWATRCSARCLRQRGQLGIDLGGVAFAGFRSDQVAKCVVPRRFAASQRQRGMRAPDRRVCLLQRGGEAWLIEHQQQLAGTDPLVVVHEHLGDQPPCPTQRAPHRRAPVHHASTGVFRNDSRGRTRQWRQAHTTSVALQRPITASRSFISFLEQGRAGSSAPPDHEQGQAHQRPRGEQPVQAEAGEQT